MQNQICLVTVHKSPNYGSLLQATALSKYLREKGYNVTFLDCFKVLPYFLRHPSLMIRRIQNKLLSARWRKFFRPSPYNISDNRRKRINKYIQDNINELTINKSSTWKSVLRQNTTFIVGSDILWQPSMGYPTTSFLDFAYFTDLKKISYATSIGALELPHKYYSAYRKYLGAFSHISVREQAAADMMGEIIHRKIEKVVDPTLLLTEEEWDEFAQRAEISINVTPGKYILCYFVMDDLRYWEYVKKVHSITGLHVVVLPMHYNDENQPYDIVLDGTPYEFIWLIKNAGLICTDSFHACVFSTIYKKEFYLLKRARRAEDDKYADFLKRYQLTERIVIDESVFQRKPNVDFQYAEKQIGIDQKQSMHYLEEALLH